MPPGAGAGAGIGSSWRPEAPAGGNGDSEKDGRRALPSLRVRIGGGEEDGGRGITGDRHGESSAEASSSGIIYSYMGKN